MDDRRKFSRVLFQAKATLSHLPTFWQTQVHDLSLNGALIQRPNNFTDIPNKTFKLSLFLPSTDIEISMDAKIVYSSEKQLGLRCIDIDVESMGHLKRLVELNCGNPNLLHRELPQFIREHSLQTLFV
ncbi:PilZ domain-containing protein [Parashewanella spongiae]|uniref:Cyclic diguanosine monophosphate-binding protein n=1 Tax=Parashewanella spongiae TaxID=342950 RepID=A0A3A6TBJ6_9GAMM|nr:PilZ domain-containing protein [Parashewanella spongiae]MCL1079804.1 PilZ domain-containing protein [Parashewanella spongiae]RJY06806.1 PilZ domain-containing protein [Parashewanella spongiae]